MHRDRRRVGVGIGLARVCAIIGGKLYVASGAFKSGLVDNGRTRKVTQAPAAPTCATFSRVPYRLCANAHPLFRFSAPSYITHLHIYENREQCCSSDTLASLPFSVVVDDDLFSSHYASCAAHNGRVMEATS